MGLKIINRTTGEFLDQESFHPLLVALSESIALTQDKDPKYTYKFFKDILHGCMCSRLSRPKDIENYSDGFFVHATHELVSREEKEFACCLTQHPSKEEEGHEHEEPLELEFEHEHEHEYEYDEISDAIVERAELLDLEQEKIENPVEAIILELTKMAHLQEKLKEQDKELSSTTVQGLFPLAGGFYYMKNKKQRRDDIQKERDYFTRVLEDLKNIPGALYQKLQAKYNSRAGTDDVALATGEHNADQEYDEHKYVGNEERMHDPHKDSDVGHSDKNKKSNENGNTRKGAPSTRRISSSVRQFLASAARPALLPVRGFIPTTQSLPKYIRPDIIQLHIQAPNVILKNKFNLLVIDGQAMIPGSSAVDCSAMQPTMGNLVLGLQKTLNLNVIQSKDIHLLIDSHLAARYFNSICRRMNWDFDSSQFDPRKPFIIKMGDRTITINLNMQKAMMLPAAQKKKRKAAKLPETEEGKPQRVLLPAAEMMYEGVLIVPPEKLEVPQTELKALTVRTMPESLVASMLLAGIAQAQELEKYNKLLESVQWMKNIQLLLQAQRALFEFVSLMAPKPYERVMSKLNEIMSNQDNIRNDLVGDKLQNFFENPGKGITADDINEYFEFAPSENIIAVFDVFNKVGGLTDDQKYYFLNTTISHNSLASLFERMPVENLLEFIKYLNSQQRLDIVQSIPKQSLKKFVNDLNMQEFYELFQGIHSDKMKQIKLSDTENLFDNLWARTLSLYSESHGNLGEHSAYVTMSDLQHMGAKALEELGIQRQQAYKQWKASEQLKLPSSYEPSSHEALPFHGRHTAPIRTPIIPPVNYRRALQPGSIRQYLSEHGGDFARRVITSGLHGKL